MLKSLLRIIRPVNLFIIAATMLVMCIKYISEGSENLILNMVLLILPAVLTAAAGYVINDIYDIETDKINKPERLVVGVGMTVANAWIIYSILSIGSIVISAIFSNEYLIINAGMTALLFLYSYKLKGTPLLGNLVVALCSAAVIACCILKRNGQKIIEFETSAGFFNFAGYIVFAFFISLIREVVKDMQDVEGDTLAGLKTYPIVAGIKGARILVYVFTGLEILFCGLYSLLAYWMADMYTSSVIMALITLSLFYFINRLSRAKTHAEFGQCSVLLKYIMFAGVMNVIFS
jgi:4-hydroxybenzoate polyprenyltransferase